MEETTSTAKTYLNGDRLDIRPLQKRDADALATWGVHTDSLLFGYNYTDLSPIELRLWYTSKRIGLFNKYYAIVDKSERFIGYIGIKQINPILRTSKLGLVLDPNHLEKGYGTEAMRLFLDYYFEVLGMMAMDLEVNDFNTRARRLYEKLGFVYGGECLEHFENQNLTQKEIDALGVAKSFIQFKGDWYTLIHKMKLKRPSAR